MAASKSSLRKMAGDIRHGGAYLELRVVWGREDSEQAACGRDVIDGEALASCQAGHPGRSARPGPHATAVSAAGCLPPEIPAHEAPLRSLIAVL